MTQSDSMLVLQSGGAMCLAAGGYLILLLRLWPRAFLKRFPEEIRAVVPPLGGRERGLAMLAGVPLFAMLLGFPAWAAWRIHVLHAGQASFIQLFAAAYGVWMLFNLFDWVVLDELLIGVGRPSWLTLKGAEHIPLRFDHAEHAAAFLKGSIGGAVVAAMVALVVASGWIG